MSAALVTSSVAESDLLADERLYEIVDGELVEKVMSGSSGWITGRLDQLLGSFASQRGLGTVVPETLFVLDPVRPLQRRPDVAFISAAKWPVGRMPEHIGEWEIVPDLVIEVLSPSNVYEEMLGKIREYFDYGVAEVWVVSPQERVVQVFRSSLQSQAYSSADTVTTDLLPGLTLAVGALIPAPEEAGGAAALPP